MATTLLGDKILHLFLYSMHRLAIIIIAAETVRYVGWSNCDAAAEEELSEVEYKLHDFPAILILDMSMLCIKSSVFCTSSSTQHRHSFIRRQGVF